MDRITGKDAKLMMEALASVYTKEEVEQEVISEEVAETELVLENEEYEKLDENLLQLFTRNRTVYRRDPKTGEKIKVDQQRDPKNLDKYVDKKTSGTGDYGYRDKKPGEAGDGTMGNFVRRKGPIGGGTQEQKPLTAKDRAYGPNSTLNKDQQAVNREYDRLRKSDPEAAAVYGKKMAARGAARSDFKIEKPTQAQSNPTAAQKQARVDAAIKSVNTPEKMNKQHLLVVLFVLNKTSRLLLKLLPVLLDLWLAQVLVILIEHLVEWLVVAQHLNLLLTLQLDLLPPLNLLLLADINFLLVLDL